MELKLEQFISDVELLTNIHEQNKNALLFRVQQGTAEMGLVFYCAYRIPRYVVLPRNAIWFDFDPESPTFKHAFRRTLKHATDPTEDQWEQLYFFDDAMAAQDYDPADLQIINQSMPSKATKSTFGIGYLSYPQPDSRAIIEGDPSLTDKREPLEHKHPEIPASMLSINGSYGIEFIPIQDQNIPTVSQVLVYKDNKLQWRKIKEEEM